MKCNLTEEKSEIQVKADFVDYAKVPFEMAQKGKVSGNAVKLYIIYFSYTFNWKGSEPKKMKRIIQAVIAENLGYSVTTVSKLNSELHDKGWITIKRTGRTNIITLHGKPKRRSYQTAETHNNQE